jgi:hypothetical protein
LEDEKSNFFGKIVLLCGLPFHLEDPNSMAIIMHFKWGLNGTISMDITFGTKNAKFHLFTLIVFNEWKNGVSIAWVIIFQ